MNHWEKFKSIHHKETVIISEAYLRGELSREELIKTYMAMPYKRHAGTDARCLAKFLDKRKDSLSKGLE